MISFFPQIKETRTISLDKTVLEKKLQKHIYSFESGQSFNYSKDHYFNGIISSGGFTISQQLKIPSKFTPIIKGDYVKSGENILLNLTFELPQESKKRLLIWTALTFLFSLYFSLLYFAWLYGAICFGICLVNYILSIENFKAQAKKSNRMLNMMLS